MGKKPSVLDLSRRRFISGAASTVAAATILPRYVLGGPGYVPPSDKVNVAMIGVGGQGRTNLRALFQEDDCQVIAIADPAEQWDLSPFYYQGKAGRGPIKEEIEKTYGAKTPAFKCNAYEDFREMLEKEKAIDAVLIATPDHLHAYITITAMKAGKHVYCEKPLTHNIWEARTVAKVAKETGVATQMGNQGRSSEGHRQTVEWIWDGAIGQIHEVHAWSSSVPNITGKGRPKETPAVPSGFNWDLWLGPREERPYHPLYAPYNWRWWWAFGNGVFPDMSIHHLDPAFNALKLDHPPLIEASAAALDKDLCPDGTFVTYRYPARDKMAPVTVYWYDAGLRPPTPIGIDPDDPKQRLGEGGNGIIFIGEKGIITCAGWSGMPRLLPIELHREYKRPEKTIPRVKGHHADWLQACKGGTPSSANFEYGARLTEFILLGNVALRTGKLLKWDGPNMKTTNVPEAAQYLKEPYRKGWELPL
jgi:predicted dehydrogenase